MQISTGLVLAFTLAGIAFSAAGNAAESTGTPRVSLLELYTSEGCDRCPPADRFVSDLPRPQLVPHKLVVLTFHVDYWNYLGWHDRFSQRRFTERQQALVRANGLRTAYTPQLVLNGRDYRDRSGIEKQVARSNAQAPLVHLRLNAEKTGSTLKASVVVNPVLPATAPPMELYLALYENNLESAVQSGENRGRVLRHDYVVRTLVGPIPVNLDKPTRWEQSLPLAAELKIADLGLAAFVQSAGSGEVFQAAAQAIK